MTLIGGFRAYSLPMLIGDFALSVQGERSGLRKKVHKLASNCSIAWTGHLVAAEKVVLSLRQRFSGYDLISKEELEKALTSFGESDFDPLAVVLIGWVNQPQQQFCFRWGSDWPKEVFYGDPMYNGSGADVIEKFFGVGMHDPTQPHLVDIQLAIDICLAFTTRLMSMEMEINCKLTFGHAYEILYFANNEFHYVDNVLYLTLTIQFDDDERIMKADFGDVFYKYRSFGEYAVTERHDRKQGGSKMNIITSLGSDRVKEKPLVQSLIQNYDYRMASRYYCIFIQFCAPNYTSKPFALLERGDIPPENCLIEADNGGLNFKLNEPMMKQFYNTVRKHE